jgi:hypothetical protein
VGGAVVYKNNQHVNHVEFYNFFSNKITPRVVHLTNRGVLLKQQQVKS